MSFDLIVITVATIAGGVAAVSGFGIGSLLTPLFAVSMGTKLAVAAVSIPHLIGTAFRFWLVRSSVDRRLLWSFGLTSAAGGLFGALVHSRVSSPSLTIVFGVLLVFAGITGLLRVADRVHLHGSAAWIAGLVSGVLGGMVGNQGGIRSAALLGFNVPRHAFVATATAIALFVDAARMPVYFASQFRDIVGVWFVIVVAVAGVLLGTIAGARVLRYLPERLFRRVVSAVILVLGLYMLYLGLPANLPV